MKNENQQLKIFIVQEVVNMKLLLLIYPILMKQEHYIQDLVDH